MNSTKRFSSFSLCLFFLLFLPALLIASNYPKPTDDYVNDFAEVLDEGDYNYLWDMLDKLEYQTGIEAVVVTVDRVSDYNTSDYTIEAFATGLFNDWGIGHKKENNGILILLSVRDKKCRIELGGGYKSYYDSVMKGIVDRSMVPEFRNGNYSKGLRVGTEEVIKSVTEEVSWFEFYKWHLLIVLLILVCLFAGINCMKNGKKGWGWAFFAAGGFLLILLIKMFLSGKRSSGFGGGSSFGGGASGSW